MCFLVLQFVVFRRLAAIKEVIRLVVSFFVKALLLILFGLDFDEGRRYFGWLGVCIFFEILGCCLFSHIFYVSWLLLFGI